MKRIGHVATYPARRETLPETLRSVVDQLDHVFVVLNEFDAEMLAALPRFDNVVYHVPEEDLKDTGKFLRPAAADEHVFLLDDDIRYPADYCDALVAFHDRLPPGRCAVGLHGVVYSDLFEGAPQSRFVIKFDKALDRPMLVNQLGTGCAMVRGDLLPPFERMRSSQRFVDVRFARLCHEAGVRLVCAPRAAGWLVDLEPEESIFESYTRLRHREQLDEIGVFCGFGRLDPRLSMAVERL